MFLLKISQNKYYPGLSIKMTPLVLHVKHLWMKAVLLTLNFMWLYFMQLITIHPPILICIVLYFFYESPRIEENLPHFCVRSSIAKNPHLSVFTPTGPWCTHSQNDLHQYLIYFQISFQHNQTICLFLNLTHVETQKLAGT